jgi:diguanylate cyclase (GGDEF)-like protein
MPLLYVPTIYALMLSVMALLGVLMLFAWLQNRAVRKQAAMTDPLTGLFNRRAFIDLAERRLRQRERDGTALAFLVFDLDWFKSVNDTHGHAIGDLALRLFAGIMRTNLRPEDIAGRIGGEEFVAILSGADETAAKCVAERIRAKFAAAGEKIEGEPVEVTVSIGVACCRRGEAADLERLAEAADEALYRAKAHGRNRVELAGDETVTLVPELPDEDVTPVAA